MLLDGRDEDEREMFLDELYSGGKDEASAQDWAMAELRRHMEEQGTWEEGEDGQGLH